MSMRLLGGGRILQHDRGFVNIKVVRRITGFFLQRRGRLSLLAINIDDILRIALLVAGSSLFRDFGLVQRVQTGQVHHIATVALMFLTFRGRHIAIIRGLGGRSFSCGSAPLRALPINSTVIHLCVNVLDTRLFGMRFRHFAGLESVVRVLSLSSCGNAIDLGHVGLVLPFWSSDIGGFRGDLGPYDRPLFRHALHLFCGGFGRSILRRLHALRGRDSRDLLDVLVPFQFDHFHQLLLRTLFGSNSVSSGSGSNSGSDSRSGGSSRGSLRGDPSLMLAPFLD
mmetsp:Transcript_34893/g.74429  ORF Transcript_34893/g.74429 Transcript_34893/m.74429 type:complete len:282 (+) Transcript_34893:3650-4495(+)